MTNLLTYLPQSVTLFVNCSGGVPDILCEKKEVVPADQVMPEAMKLAEKISTECAPLAVQATKEDLRMGMRMLTTPPDGSRFAQLNYLRCWNSEDRVEGLKAFQEKRKPEWKGQ